MPTRLSGRASRSDLFVVRIWCEDPDPTCDQPASETRTTACRGRVQRASSGEAHEFQGWVALIEVLEGMLGTADPTRKTGTARDGKDSGNKAKNEIKERTDGREQ